MQGYDYYTTSELEQKAEYIIGKYCEKFDYDLLENPQPLDIEHFAEIFMKLAIEYQNLSQYKTILGCTAFNDGRLEVWNDARAEKIIIDVKKGTVLIENDLLSEINAGRLRFTIAHECCHQILHRQFYRDNAICSADYIEGDYNKIQNKHEWQANYLGAAFLMPKPMIEKLLNDLTMNNISILKRTPLNYKTVNWLAETFGVSKSAMKIRLRALGFKMQEYFEE